MNLLIGLDHALVHDMPSVRQIEISRNSASGTGVHDGPWGKQRRTKTVDNVDARTRPEVPARIYLYHPRPLPFRSEKTRICKPRR